MEVNTVSHDEKNKRTLMNLLAFPALIGGISDYTGILEDYDKKTNEGDDYNGKDEHIEKTQSGKVNI